MSAKVLGDNWNDYDQRKQRNGQDARFFDGRENWEQEYLVGKYRASHPYLTRAAIKAALAECSGANGRPRPREQFVTCVSERLGV